MSWAIWLTGPPAAGKTTLARAFLEVAAAEGVRVVHMESDALRRILTPEPTYSRQERDRFYGEVAELAALLVSQGFPVVVDATAPRRAYRDRLRSKVEQFLEVFVDAPREVREARDPKGLYRLGRAGRAPNLINASEGYEKPARPELAVSGTGPPEEALTALVRLARERKFL